MNKRILALALEGAGLDPERLAALKEKYATPRLRISLNNDLCLACNVKPGSFRGDYVCGTCSGVKAKTPRRFWQYVIEREEGLGPGRPLQQKGLPQKLPPQVGLRINVFLPAIPDDLPEKREPERFEFLVSFGRVSLVVVANYAYETVRIGRAALGLGDTAGHGEILCLGRTERPLSEAKDFE